MPIPRPTSPGIVQCSGCQHQNYDLEHEGARPFFQYQGYTDAEFAVMRTRFRRGLINPDPRLIPELVTRPNQRIQYLCEACSHALSVCTFDDCGALHFSLTRAHPERVFECFNCGEVRQTEERSTASALQHHSRMYCNTCAVSIVQQCDDCGDTWLTTNYDHCPCSDAYAHGWEPDAYRFFTKAHVSTDEPAKKTLYLGMELEVETGSLTTQKDVTRMVKKSGLPLYAKRDGSLDCGVEIVSMPLTLDAWREYWPDLCTFYGELRDMGVKAFNTSTCGLHIHSARSGYRTLNHLYRVGLLMYHNKPFVKELSGRRDGSLDRWATLDDVTLDSAALYNEPREPRPIRPGATEWRAMSTEARQQWENRRLRYMSQQSRLANTSRSLIAKVRQSHTVGWHRYAALNLTPAHTAEFRFFKGTLYAPAIMRALESIQAFRDFTLDASPSEAKQLPLLTKYVDEQRKQFPHFSTWLHGSRDFDTQRSSNY